MLGLGETRDEVVRAMHDLRAAGCDILTLGQYLRPTEKHLPVEEFVRPEAFAELEQEGLALGFRFVAAGPLVRSSYKAGEFFVRNWIEGPRLGAAGS
jgi:lipoic acid synthetase